MTEDTPNSVSTPGAGIAARIARTVADASIYTRARMAPHLKAIALSTLGDFTDIMSDESKEAVGPLLTALADTPDLSPHARALLDFMTKKRGQWQALAAGSATGAAFGGGLINLLTNELNPGILRLIAANPNNVLSPESAAAAKARELPGPPTWDVEANKSGIDDNRFAALVELSRHRPTSTELMDLINRGLIKYAEAWQEMRRNGYEGTMAELMLETRKFVPSPADLSAMWNRSIVSTEEGAKLAAMSGVSAEDWHRLTELGGEPLAPQDLGEAFRRGFIDRSRYNRGIVQGPLRNEWFDVLEALQYKRMSVIDAADAVNQGHMTADEGRKVAVANGLDAKDFETLLVTAGAPPGIDFATEALNRGFVDTAGFTRMFLESRIKNVYLPLLLQMSKRLIPQETVRLLFRHGVYDRGKTIKTLLGHGFTEEDAASLLALEETRDGSDTKDLTRAEIADMYLNRMLTADEAQQSLEGIGFNADDAKSIIELADLKRLRRFVDAIVTKVRASYVNGRIDGATASASLDQLGLPSAQRDDLLDLWDIERTTVSKTLTSAQVLSAFKKGFIERDDAANRLSTMGYDNTDVGILIRLSGGEG